MSFVDQPSGWQWPAVAATVLAQGALLAVFAAAFHVAQTVPDGPKAASLVAFDLSPPPVEAETQTADQRPAPARPTRPQPPALPARQPRPSALPQTVAPQAGIAAAQLPVKPAPAPSPPSPPPSPPAPAANAPQQADALAAYAKALRQRIMERLPGGLQRAGAVTVAFTLDRTGRMTDAQVVQSSRDVQLDRTALRMVRAAAPFPAPPADVAADVADARLHFSIEVHFH